MIGRRRLAAYLDINSIYFTNTFSVGCCNECLQGIPRIAFHRSMACYQDKVRICSQEGCMFDVEDSSCIAGFHPQSILVVHIQYKNCHPKIGFVGRYKNAPVMFGQEDNICTFCIIGCSTCCGGKLHTFLRWKLV